MVTRPLALVVCLLLAAGCQLTPPPEPPPGPPPEDLSSWAVPMLVQPPKPAPRPPRLAVRPASPAETVYAYAAGGVYKVTVALDAPLDLILEAGEKVHAMIGTDPKPIAQGPAQPGDAPSHPDAPGPGVKLQARWEYKEAIEGVGDHVTPHIYLRALEAGATLGLTVTTSMRTYYLNCRSVLTSPIRAVRWTYPPLPVETARDGENAPGLLPAPEEARLYHVGYEVQYQGRKPDWLPRGAWDDGKKFYLMYPEVTLFGTVPLVRTLAPTGPQVVNSHQFLNVLMLDMLPPKLELRVGTGEQAEVVTITRGNLRTIECPGDSACPVWPAAAKHLTGR